MPSHEVGKIVAKMDQWFYPDCEDHWDSKIFATRIKSLIRPGFTVLDLGAGRGALSHLDMRQEDVQVFGTDIDPAVEGNQQIDEGRTIEPDGTIPWGRETFDLAFSSFVWEHVEHPLQFLGEVARVLKPGGLYLAQTPSSRHYVAAAARLTSYGFHKRFNALRGRDVVDTFPTFYRLNSRSQINRAALSAGLETQEIEFIEKRPEYLRISPITYLPGIAYERLVNLDRRLESLRASLIATLQRPLEVGPPAPKVGE
jgi:SAM-dependent methyltransferase